MESGNKQVVFNSAKPMLANKNDEELAMLAQKYWNDLIPPYYDVTLNVWYKLQEGLVERITIKTHPIHLHYNYNPKTDFESYKYRYWITFSDESQDILLLKELLDIWNCCNNKVLDMYKIGKTKENYNFQDCKYGLQYNGDGFSNDNNNNIGFPLDENHDNFLDDIDIKECKIKTDDSWKPTTLYLAHNSENSYDNEQATLWKLNNKSISAPKDNCFSLAEVVFTIDKIKMFPKFIDKKWNYTPKLEIKCKSINIIENIDTNSYEGTADDILATY